MKSSPHIIGEFIKLPREMSSKREFSPHISREGYVVGGSHKITLSANKCRLGGITPQKRCII